MYIRRYAEGEERERGGKKIIKQKGNSLTVCVCPDPLSHPTHTHTHIHTHTHTEGQRGTRDTHIAAYRIPAEVCLIKDLDGSAAQRVGHLCGAKRGVSVCACVCVCRACVSCVCVYVCVCVCVRVRDCCSCSEERRREESEDSLSPFASHFLSLSHSHL